MWCLCCGLDKPVFESWQGSEFFIFPEYPFFLWGPPSLLFGGYQGSFHMADWDMKPSTHVHLVPRLRMSGAVPLFPLYLLIL